MDPSLGPGPSLNTELQGKPNATFGSKSGPLSGLALNKKRNLHSVRGKKILARSFPGNSLSNASTNPFHDLPSKLTPLSASTFSSASHETNDSPSDSFKFMASNDEGLGAINGCDGNRKSSGGHGRVQSKNQVHSEVGHFEEEGSLGLENEDAGIFAGPHLRKGSDDEIGEVDKMVSEEGDEAYSSL